MKILKISCFIFFIFMTSLAGFFWWNHYPPLPKETFTPIFKIKNKPILNKFPEFLKVVSYNIHFGIGFDWKRKDNVNKKGFLKRLDQIAKCLRDIDADIVLLQEVDFNSQRSCNIDQSIYLARKANYPYIAKSIHLKEKFHPSIQGLHGKINHGICVLSKFKISKNLSKVFIFPKTVPFYVKWLYSPHGAQRLKLSADRELEVINLHLEPWCQKTRESQSLEISKWIRHSNLPIIIGGDFNALPPDMPSKKYLYLSDTPWFINKKKWNLDNEKTITQISTIAGIFSSPQKLENNYTFPSNNPLEQLDYIFSNCKIVDNYIYKKANTYSDHLPIVAIIQLK